ncbi:hypothetical protein ES707_13691 [subsurface metagenome]
MVGTLAGSPALLPGLFFCLILQGAGDLKLGRHVTQLEKSTAVDNRKYKLARRLKDKILNRKKRKL